MASKSIDIIISTVFKKTGIDKAITQIKELGKSVGRNMANIKAGFDLAAGGISKFISAMSKGMEFERMTTQFKALTGSMETAKAHMKDLQDLGRTPPFSLEQFAAASQAMMKMTGGMAGFKKEMEIVGDMAAATGNDIATVGRAFGLAYQVIRDGQDFGSAGQQLYSLGIMTKQQVADFSELFKAGADNMEMWKQLTDVFGRYKGAMADTEKTTKGMIEAIQGEATVAMTEFSSAISESAKPALEGLLGYLKRINEDGTIEEWANKCVDAMERVADGARPLIKLLSFLGGSVFKSIKGVAESVAQAGGNAVGVIMGGGSVKDAASGAWRGFKQGWVDAFDTDGAESEYQSNRKEKRREEKARKKAEREAKLEAEAQAKIEADMARGKEESERRAAEKAAEEHLKAEEKAIAEEQKLREKMEKELHAQRVADLNAEANIAKANMDATNRTISAAQSEFDKAFAMYRSEDKGAAQIAEERDYAADYKQLQKDAARYGGKWRIDELSSLMAAGDTQGQAAKLEEWRKSRSFTPEVESMVRAAAADQTKTTAEDELRKIEQNTADLAQKLDELLQVK